jgi:aerobic-type carbon monoxide dehydrogenase small subunit (CoxS/CutS family)
MSEKITMSEKAQVHLIVNEQEFSRYVEPRLLLSDFLRTELGLTGTHVGCEHGICGACTIIIDGRAARSCLMFAVQANGLRVETVEGLSDCGKIQDLQEAFSCHHALQCGFCTGAMLVIAHDLLKSDPNPNEESVKDAMSAALCRCTGYWNIIEAVQSVVRSRNGALPQVNAALTEAEK